MITPKFEHLESVTIMRNETTGERRFIAHFDWTQEVTVDMRVPVYNEAGNRLWGQWGSERTTRRIRQQHSVEITYPQYLAYKTRGGEAVQFSTLSENCGVVYFLHTEEANQ